MYDEGKQLADEYGIEFFETSALTGYNVITMCMAISYNDQTQEH